MDFVRLDRADTVVTATRSLALGTLVDGVATTVSIPSGHKVATAQMSVGDPVRKYAQLIGYASQDIVPGDHVHTHNVDFRNTAMEYEFSTDLSPVAWLQRKITLLGFAIKKAELAHVITSKLEP